MTYNVFIFYVFFKHINPGPIITIVKQLLIYFWTFCSILQFKENSKNTRDLEFNM